MDSIYPLKAQLRVPVRFQWDGRPSLGSSCQDLGCPFMTPMYLCQPEADSEGLHITCYADGMASSRGFESGGCSSLH